MLLLLFIDAQVAHVLIVCEAYVQARTKYFFKRDQNESVTGWLGKLSALAHPLHICYPQAISCDR